MVMVERQASLVVESAQMRQTEELRGRTEGPSGGPHCLVKTGLSSGMVGDRKV